MVSLHIQVQNLGNWILTYFYYLQFQIAERFSLSDRQAFGIALMLVLSLIYLTIISLIAARVFIKTKGRRARTLRGDSILLLGPCGSGKTCLFYSVINKRFPRTVTSMKENIASFDLEPEVKVSSNDKKKSAKMIDFPGHASLRSQLPKYYHQTRAIVFMIDGTNYDVKEIAEYLYDVFVNSEYLAHPCPILIAVNKSDLPRCDSNEVVFAKIEKELDQIKESRGSVEAVGEKDVNKLGVEGQTFSFEKDAPSEVYSCNCSVMNGQVEKIEGFITAVLS